MLSHLIYLSTRTAQCTDAEIEKILDASRRNNPGREVTGVLLYSDTQFLQYIEGDYKTLIALYDKLKEDKRHKNPILISSAPIQSRTFPSWNMGARKLGTSSIEFNGEMSEEDRETFAAILKGDSNGAHKAIGLIGKFFK